MCRITEAFCPTPLCSLGVLTRMPMTSTLLATVSSRQSRLFILSAPKFFQTLPITQTQATSMCFRYFVEQHPTFWYQILDYYHNKRSQTRWLKRTEMYCLIVLEARSLKSLCQQDHDPSGTRRRASFLATS